MARNVTFIIPRAFIKASKRVFRDEHIEAVKAKLALRPELGDLVPGTGGARKIRQFGIGGQSRVIYYYQRGDGEIYLLACYPKNRQADLSEGEKSEIKETIKLIKARKRRGKR